MSRLASGGQIDRSTSVSFSFDGKTYRGFKGDLYDGGLRVPGVIHWPGRTTAGSASRRATAVGRLGQMS